MNEQPVETSNKAALENKLRSSSRLIGCGYDVTEEYMQSTSARAKILDYKKLKVENKILKRNQPSTVVKVIVGENAEDYCQNLSSELKLGASKAAFSGAISAKFKGGENHSYKYSYGSLFQIINMEKKYISISKSELKNFVSEDFLNYVKNSSADDIIAQYGTHIITDVILGGRLEITYRSIIQSQNKSSDMEFKLNASVKKMFSAEGSTSISGERSKKNEESSLYIQTIGGDPCKGITVTAATDEGLSLKSNFDDWKNSLSDANIDLIYMDNVGISLDEVIPDTEEYRSKKYELREGIERYLIDREFKITKEPSKEKTKVPFIRYYSASENDHFYTLNKGEHQYVQDIYNLEGITCEIFEAEEEGTVPIFRYMNGARGQGIDHFYTTNWNELQNGAMGYHYEGIAGYIYPTDYNKDNSLVPLYRCCRDVYRNGKKMIDHFYTLNRDEFEENGRPKEGIRYEGILGQVYKSTKNISAVL